MRIQCFGPPSPEFSRIQLRHASLRLRAFGMPCRRLPGPLAGGWEAVGYPSGPSPTPWRPPVTRVGEPLRHRVRPPIACMVARSLTRSQLVRRKDRSPTSPLFRPVFTTTSDANFLRTRFDLTFFPRLKMSRGKASKVANQNNGVATLILATFEVVLPATHCNASACVRRFRSVCVCRF